MLCYRWIQEIHSNQVKLRKMIKNCGLRIADCGVLIDPVGGEGTGTTEVRLRLLLALPSEASAWEGCAVTVCLSVSLSQY